MCRAIANELGEWTGRDLAECCKFKFGSLNRGTNALARAFGDISRVAYRLSPAKLQTYRTCPAQFRFRYELGLSGGFFGSATFGRALHGAMLRIYRDWDYGTHRTPTLEWLDRCWAAAVIETPALTGRAIDEGYDIMARYHREWIEPRREFPRPLVTEGSVKGALTVDNVEFAIAGKIDRLDWTGPRDLALFDYKTSKTAILDPERLDLQLGLYALAIEQQWPGELKTVTLLFLRSGTHETAAVTDAVRHTVQTAIADLALRLRSDDTWEPHTGDHCDRCAFHKYCAAHHADPEPVPSPASPPPLQLNLGL